jgi:uncharacterized protein (DUF1778 family)
LKHGKIELEKRSQRSDKLEVRGEMMRDADESMSDRCEFRLDAVQWKAFLAALDSPPRPMPRLERLLKHTWIY